MDGNKGWSFLDKVTLQSLSVKLFSFVSNEDYLEIVCAAKCKLLCLESVMGKSSNFGSSSEEGFGFSK